MPRPISTLHDTLRTRKRTNLEAPRISRRRSKGMGMHVVEQRLAKEGALANTKAVENDTTTESWIFDA